MIFAGKRSSPSSRNYSNRTSEAGLGSRAADLKGRRNREVGVQPIRGPEARRREALAAPEVEVACPNVRAQGRAIRSLRLLLEHSPEHSAPIVT